MPCATGSALSPSPMNKLYEIRRTRAQSLDFSPGECVGRWNVKMGRLFRFRVLSFRSRDSMCSSHGIDGGLRTNGAFRSRRPDLAKPRSQPFGTSLRTSAIGSGETETAELKGN
jgi:hypothetical protein